MRKLGCAVLRLGRRPLAAVLAVALLGAVWLLFCDEGTFASCEGSLSSCFFTLASGAMCTFVLTPAFLLCSSSVRSCLLPHAAFRRGTRASLWRACGAATLFLALAFSLLITVTALGVVVLRSGYASSLGDCLLFGAVVLPLMTTYFLVCGLLQLCLCLWLRSFAPAFATGLAYGALDYALSMTPLVGNELLWTGWRLVTLTDLVAFGTYVSYLVRLLSCAALFGLGAFVAVTRCDLVGGEVGYGDE